MTLTPQPQKAFQLPEEIADLVTRATVIQILRVWTNPGDEDRFIDALPKALSDLKAEGYDTVELWIHEPEQFAQYPTDHLGSIKP